MWVGGKLPFTPPPPPCINRNMLFMPVVASKGRIFYKNHAGPGHVRSRLMLVLKEREESIINSSLIGDRDDMELV